MNDTDDIIRSLRKTFDRVGQAAQQITTAFEEFVGVPDRLTWPVMWCRDHEALESVPGCMLNQARRGL